jgi:type VI secretion system lysozyme-like protein
MTYVLASFLDRIMPDGDGSTSAPPGYCTLRAYAAAVARDLEALLNTRNALIGKRPVPGILGFGVPDFSSFVLASSADRTRMVEAIRLAITTHEPRLKSPTVLLGDRPQCTASLHFLISGKLDTDAHAPPLHFSAEFLSTTLHFAVRTRDGERFAP